MKFLCSIPHQFHLDGAPAPVGIGLRVVGEGVKVRHVPTDGSESPLLIFPAFAEESLSARGHAHALEHRCGNWILLGFPRTDYVNGNSLRLGQFADVFRGDHAGPVRTIGENYDYFSAGKLDCIFKSQQQGVVERGLISSYSRAHAAQDLGTVGSQHSASIEVTAVGIEGDPFRIIERPDKVGNCILSNGETTVHIVTGIKKYENIGAGKNRTGDTSARRSFGGSDGLALSLGLGYISHLLRLIAFSKGSNFFGDAIFRNYKVRRTKTGQAHV